MSTVIIASTKTGEPFEPARGWSDVTVTEKVVAKEILESSDGTSLVKVVAVRQTVPTIAARKNTFRFLARRKSAEVDAVGTSARDSGQRVVRFFPPDQMIQEVL